MITIDRKNFNSLDDAALTWVCIEPTIRQMRGRDYALKSEVYLRLTEGQKALLMYQILHGHSTYGVDEFYASLTYALTDEAFWKQLMNGMRRFGDNTKACLIEEMKKLYPNSKNGEYEEEKKRIDRELKDSMAGSVKLAAAYIRSHTDEFAVLTD